MNVFEDLVVELKEENLLEETVIDLSKVNGTGMLNGALPVPEFVAEAPSEFQQHNLEPPLETRSRGSADHKPAPKFEVNQRRLSEWTTALQHVEYVLTAMENMVSGGTKPVFDDLPVKKALHTYIQASSEPESDEYLAAESAMVTALENWEDDLAKRDQSIDPDDLRVYGETANPPLSPQALFSLVRFYRSAPLTEATSAKFDSIVTRLFSKFLDGKRREMLCPRQDIIRHLNQRYRAWGFDVEPVGLDDPDITLLQLTFDDFAAEAESAASISELVSAGIFGRICEFKQSVGTLLFSSQVAAAAIECNLRVSAKVIDLASNSAADQLTQPDKRLISRSVARTLDFGRDVPEAESTSSAPEPDTAPAGGGTEQAKKQRAAGKRSTSRPGGALRKSTLFGVNRWLLLGTFLTVMASVGIYVWAEYLAAEPTSSAGVRTVDLENPEIKMYVKTAKVSGDLLYAVVNTEFDKLSRDDKGELLRKMLAMGEQKGFRKITLINPAGKHVGYASDNRTDIPGE
jgi:hypothetical protein